MHHKRSSYGFTLIELLVSAVVVSLVGSAAWFSASVLMQTNEVTSNNIVAVNLLRKSQEEVRRVVQNNFDNIGLGSCTFVNANTCGFEDISANFPGYTRTLAVLTPGGTTELKHVLIVIGWNELGRARTLRSVILLSRPARSLPGNIIGNVTDRTSGVRIAAATIVAVKASPPMTLPTTSQAGDVPRTDGRSVNFSFVNAVNQFQMDAGNWTLSATAAGYRPYIHPAGIEIQSNTEEQVNFSMERAPTPARISVRLTNSGAPVTYAMNIPVGLYQRGSSVAQATVSGLYTFPDITFDDTTPKCFTVATNNAYQSGFSGNFSCSSAPRTQEPRGWSSSVVQGTGSLLCAQPWNGSSAPGVDRICVSPGDNVEVNIPVVPVATATINGYVRDSNGVPISNADITIRWPDNGNYPWPNKPSLVRTDVNGLYTAIVPAVQSLFPNNAANYLRISASANANITRCCNIPGTVRVNSPVVTFGPLVSGDIRSGGDLTVTTTPQSERCGDAQGLFRDGRTGSGLSGVAVTLATVLNTTASGSYIFQCTPPVAGAFSIPVRNYTLTATKANYYSFTTAGNEYYTRVGSGVVAVNEALMNSVGTLDLWPRGTGTVRVNVVRQGSSAPIVGASVSLSGPASINRSSDASGLALFNNATESWPVPEVVGNARYNQTVRDYTVSVTHSAYENAGQSAVKLDRGNTVTITVTMIPKGGM